MVSTALALSALPPVGVTYHWMPVPVAAKLATAPLLQKLCDALPAGADGRPVTVTVVVIDADPAKLLAVNCTEYVPAALNLIWGFCDEALVPLT